jgi:site-specific DNA recombinase
LSLDNILTPGKVGVFYGRHSTDKQNMYTQLRTAYEMVEKYDCTIKEEYLDSGVSSREKNRQELQRLVIDVSKREIDFIVIYDHSRIARIPEDHDFLRLTMGVLEIPIIESSTESLYDSGDLIIRSVKDGIAKYELDKIRSNTREAMETLASKGYWTGGPAPFGYKYTKKGNGPHGSFDQVDHEVSLVKEVFRLYRKNHGFAAIAQKLPPNSHRGSRWTKDKVKNIIIDPFYAGYIAIRKKEPAKHNSIRPRSEWEMGKSELMKPIITKEEWEYCWNLYEDKKGGTDNPKKYKTSFLVRDLLVCKHCDSPLINKDQRTISSKGKQYGHRVYICKNQKCKYSLIADSVHQEIKKIFQTTFHLDKETIISNMQKKIENDVKVEKDKITVLEEQLRREKRKLNRMNEQLESFFRNAERNRDLIKILTLTKEHLEEQKNLIQASLEVFQQNVYTLEEVFLDESILLRGLDGLGSLSKEELFNVRRLYLELIDKVITDEKGNLECRLKYNLGAIGS